MGEASLSSPLPLWGNQMILCMPQVAQQLHTTQEGLQFHIVSTILQGIVLGPCYIVRPGPGRAMETMYPKYENV